MSTESPKKQAIQEHLLAIQQQIINVQTASNVCLIAVSKTQSAQAIIAAIEAGQIDFGENYVQEAIEKITALRPIYPAVVWHLIGPLQSNKTKVVAEHFDWVHTIDRLKIAQRLNEQRPKHLAPLNVLIQVNIDQEDSKSGVLATEVAALAESIFTLKHLKLRGLMCIPEKNSSAAFARMLRLWQDLNAQGYGLDCLSMGMSADYLEAIKHGATHVRIGTAIFGARSTK